VEGEQFKLETDPKLQKNAPMRGRWGELQFLFLSEQRLLPKREYSGFPFERDKSASQA